MRQSKETKRKRVWPRVLISLVVIIIVASLIALYYLFNFAFSRDGFSTQLGQGVNTEWYDTNPSQTWTQKTKSGLTLKAHYFAAAQPTNKTILVVHGYGGSARRMSTYLRMFHNEGYNVLAPDNQPLARARDAMLVMVGRIARRWLAGCIKLINIIPTGKLECMGLVWGLRQFYLPCQKHQQM